MAPADLAKVCVFDWGRSELNTIEQNATRTQADKDQRRKYWEIWERGIFRAWYEVVNLYLAQFAPSQTKQIVTFSVWDYDTYDPNDFIGSVEVDLEETGGEVELDLVSDSGGDCGTVRVEITKLPPVSSSRLQEKWAIHVIQVEGLPKSDAFSDTDPFVRVEVGAQRPDGSDWRVIGMRSAGTTQVVHNDRNAEIDKVLYFARAAPQTVQSLMDQMSQSMGTTLKSSMFDTTTGTDCDRVQRQACYEAFLAKCGPAAGLTRASDDDLLRSDSFEYGD
jgi:hypothetical protein